MTPRLVNLSMATEIAYREAARSGKVDLAEELRILGLYVQTLIAREARAGQERKS